MPKMGRRFNELRFALNLVRNENRAFPHFVSVILGKPVRKVVTRKNSGFSPKLSSITTLRRVMDGVCFMQSSEGSVL